ncbi:MAG TPA: hypothetical protein VEB86_12405, partial [Chryseosolibacter sp.]|nr:hypothetical protein [Chryseosolibacter sp.]
MRTFFLTMILMVSAAMAGAQSSFLPKSLGPSVNSIYNEINPVVTPDGSTLFFVRVNHPENTYGLRDSEDIWYSTRLNDSTWSDATRMPNLNIGRYNAVLSVSGDGNTLLLNGIYNKRGMIWKKRGFSVSERVNGTWSVPVKLRVRAFPHKNRGMRSSGSLTYSGNSLVLSYSKVYNGERNDLYYSIRKENGKFTKPKKLKGLNTRLNEETPFLSADGNVIYFASDRAGKDKFNIYKSVRQGQGWNKWSPPVMLSDTINTPGWESYFKTNVKGSWAYYASTNKSPGNADLFTVKLFEENPYVIVSGSVVNGKSHEVVKGRNYGITVDGKQPDSLWVDTDAGTYRIKLPLRHAYSIKANLDHFISTPGQVDVSRQREFTTIKMDLGLTPLPYVLVKGRVVVRNAENAGNPRNLAILVDNKVVDSLLIDDATATYQVRLPHGTSYQLQAQAYKHEPVPQILDLTGVTEYQEIERDLFLEEEKMAVVSGRILD